MVKLRCFVRGPPWEVVVQARQRAKRPSLRLGICKSRSPSSRRRALEALSFARRRRCIIGGCEDCR
eukprot:8191730-Alexandrium_andersonii.AAC.1